MFFTTTCYKLHATNFYILKLFWSVSFIFVNKIYKYFMNELKVNTIFFMKYKKLKLRYLYIHLSAYYLKDLLMEF